MTRFFVFTDWQPAKNQTDMGLDHWIPFNSGPGQPIELCQIKKEINANVDSRLSTHVLDDNRIYFRHLNRGVEWIESGSPDWKNIHGAIVESEVASSQRGHSAALERLAEGLARNTPVYLRSKLKVLVCLLPAPGLPVEEKFKPKTTFRINRPANTQKLVDTVSDWLTTASLQIDADHKGYDREIVEQVDEFMNSL
jgi:hypothetical protein